MCCNLLYPSNLSLLEQQESVTFMALKRRFYPKRLPVPNDSLQGATWG